MSNYIELNPLDHFDITPQSRAGGGGGDVHPWKVSIVPNGTNPLTGNPSAVMSPKGNIVDKLLGITLLEINNWSGESLSRTITGTGVLCMLITKATGADNPVMEVQFLKDDDYKPFELDTSQPPLVTATRYPLALIVDNPEPPLTGGTRADDYIVKQLARSHMAISNICINGQIGPSLTPI